MEAQPRRSARLSTTTRSTRSTDAIRFAARKRRAEAARGVSQVRRRGEMEGRGTDGRLEVQDGERAAANVVGDVVELLAVHNPRNLVIPAVNPFQAIRPAQNNFEDHNDNIDTRPMTNEAATAVLPLIPEQLAYENMACHPYRGGLSEMPLYSLLYSIQMTTNSPSLLSMVIRVVIQRTLGWNVEDLPTVEVYRREQAEVDANEGWQIRLQCRNASTHYWLWLMDYTFLIGQDEDTNVDYEMRLIDEGRRSEPEVYRADFVLERRAGQAYLPVDHEVAIRIAEAYAIHCEAVASPIYTGRADGIIGIWRTQLQER